MIKVIIFDIGGVYLKGTFIDFVNNAYKVLGTPGSFHTDNQPAFDKALNRGEIALEECFRKYFKVPISDQQMKELVYIWTNTWKPTPQMTELVKKLQKNYRLAVISNSDAPNAEKFFKKGWYDPFEVLVLSHKIGIIKPDKRIYEIALEKLKVQSYECVFIDDLKDCLVPASEMGMKTILFKSAKQLEEKLKKLGIDC